MSIFKSIRLLLLQRQPVFSATASNYGTTQMCLQMDKSVNKTTNTTNIPTSPTENQPMSSDKSFGSDRKLKGPFVVAGVQQGADKVEPPVETETIRVDREEIDFQDATVMDRVKEGAKEMAGKIKEKATNVVDKLKEATGVESPREIPDKIKGKAQNVAGKAIDKIDQMSDKAKAKLDERMEKGYQVTDSMHDTWDQSKEALKAKVNEGWNEDVQSEEKDVLNRAKQPSTTDQKQMRDQPREPLKSRVTETWNVDCQEKAKEVLNMAKKPITSGQTPGHLNLKPKDSPQTTNKRQ